MVFHLIVSELLDELQNKSVHMGREGGREGGSGREGEGGGGREWSGGGREGLEEIPSSDPRSPPLSSPRHGAA